MNSQLNLTLGERLLEIREDLYGEHGAQFIAEALGIPLKTWLNYGAGVVVPAHIVLQLIASVGVNPHCLLTGRGRKYGLQNPAVSQQRRIR